ncbi:MAG: S49 family peptidase [Alphaproteobacteria bacterium]|nr:S49 family peptidase [Alphaproteobacteria bacterium]
MPTLRFIIKQLSILIVAITVLVFWTQQFLWFVTPSDTSGNVGSLGSCNIADIKLEGTLYTYLTEEDSDAVSSADIVKAIEEADHNADIKAIILEIDSGGGSPVAGEEIANALKRAQKPTVAVIRQAGASAAYWSATGVDRIFASSLSDVGGIGVTMSYLDNAGKNAKDGLNYNSLSSGIYKDAGNPDKPITPEEKVLFERDLKITHERFLSQVAENRHLDIEKVRVLADGSTMMGDMALEKGLIDQIGGVVEARDYLNK